MDGHEEQDWCILIALLVLIHKGKPLNNSYKLVRVLERKFRIRHFSEMLRQMESHQYVHFELVGGVHYYHLTKTGEEIIEKEHDRAYSKLLELFPGESEYISAVFGHFLKKLSSKGDNMQERKAILENLVSFNKDLSQI